MITRLPDFIIVGEARCGSTSLWNLMSQHPEIFFPKEKELHYFGSYSRFNPCGRYKTHGIDDYAEQFEDCKPEQRCGEATPNYLSDPNSLTWINEALPEVKCIAVLRDPVARAFSHYWQSVNRGWESESFERALELEESRIRDFHPNGFHDFSYFSRGLYGDTIERLFAVRGRENCLVIFLDELKNESEMMQSKLFRFLGIRDMRLSKSGTPHSNKFGYPKSPKLYRFQLRAEKVLDRVFPSAKSIYKKIGSVTRKYRCNPSAAKLNHETEASLRIRFAASNKKLSSILGRKLPWT